MSETKPLPRLVDCRAIQTEVGVKRATAEAIMQQLPKVVIPGHRKVFVRREDVQQLLDARMRAA